MMNKMSHDVIKFIEETMKTWIVELTAGERRLAGTKIQRGIFKGDTRSPFIFIIATMPGHRNGIRYRKMFNACNEK